MKFKLKTFNGYACRFDMANKQGQIYKTKKQFLKEHPKDIGLDGLDIVCRPVKIKVQVIKP